MKIRFKKTAMLFSALACLFIGGWLGYEYKHFDILCSSNTKFVQLDTDMITQQGIIFPKGTVIEISRCAYMQRFTWHYAIENSIKLQVVDNVDESLVGFSVLEKVE